ncbi:unnamed protein product [Periconia digitata]|uniref:Protein kinase domain-containing protein n=1 Tax=Periconia digitata TaxID=1303443 RepID=A0A9W4UA96_9PLEO|nr:unnamed protein product [Periconia digitata]
MNDHIPGGYVLIKDLHECNGNNNEGISLVKDPATQTLPICKKIEDLRGNGTDMEAEALVQLDKFPNIIKLHDYNPVDSTPAAIPPSEPVPASEPPRKDSIFQPSSVLTKSQPPPDSESEAQLSPLPETRPPLNHLFLEYCDLGTLASLTNTHAQLELRIPESFIWYVLYALLKAVHACQTGLGTKPNWRPITHHDIHANNVLLSSSSPDITSSTGGYPRVVLADFGLAEYGSNNYWADVVDVAAVGMSLCWSQFEDDEIYEAMRCGIGVDIAEWPYSQTLYNVLQDLAFGDQMRVAEAVEMVRRGCAVADSMEYGGKVWPSRTVVD